MRKYRASIRFPRETPVRERLRIAWAVAKFLWEYDRATPEKREAVLGYLADNGATVTKENNGS